MKPVPPLLAAAAAAAAAALLAGCSSATKSGATGTPSARPSSPAAGATSGVAATGGYTVTVFAGKSSAYSNPDSIEVDGSRVFIGYQNETSKTGADHKSSTIVQYSLAGQVVRTFSVPGHNDGLRMDPATHQLWAMSDEDGNPILSVIDPSTGAVQVHRFGPTPHGGGYDDIRFFHGVAYVAASSPVLSGNANTHPALVTVRLAGSGPPVVTPVLAGSAAAKDAVTGGVTRINAVDPDSLFVDPQGDLTLDNQSGTSLITIHDPGPRQTVTQLMLGTAIDDTVYPTSSAGRLLVSDTAANTVYQVRGPLSTTQAYVAAPSDSLVASFVGELDPTSGTITPVIVGLLSPHGMAYLPA